MQLRDATPDAGPEAGPRDEAPALEGPPQEGPASGLSVVVPVFNRAGLVAECLGRFLGPEAEGVEVVVVDDGSTDGTAAAVEALAARAATRADGRRGAAIRLVRQENAGPGPARNRGVAEARGEWVLFHDSDDLLMPWALAHLRQVLDREPGAAAGGARVLFLAARRFSDPAEVAAWAEETPVGRRHPTLLDFKLDDPLPLAASSNVAFRRADFLALGGFHGVLRGEDTDLFFRGGALGPVAVVAAPTLVAYRVHDDPVRLTNASAAERVAMIRFLLARNRQGLYGGPADKRARALARSVAYLVRGNFAKGRLGIAYAVYVEGAGALGAAGRWGDLVRLPLTPLLHYVRPRSYPFRWPGRARAQARAQGGPPGLP